MPRPRKLDNWIMAYSEYTQGTESPPLFHLWVGLGTLASAMQRKIFLEMGHIKIHSNMYLVLVSPPGRSRKSTALKIGKSLLRGVEDWGTKINFSTQAASTAAFIQQLSKIENKEHQSLTAFSFELESLIGEKATDMLIFLTDIFDCEPDWDKQTIGRGLEKISNPWLNLLGATTPQSITDSLGKKGLEGGFASRCLFVYQDVRLRVARPSLTDRQRVLRHELIHDLAHISGLKGTFTFEDDAGRYYDDWYNNMDSNADADTDQLSTYYERKHLHVLKAAMALSIAESDRLVLDRRDIETAIKLVETLEPGIRKVLLSTGRNPFTADMLKILDQIKASPNGVPYKKILAAHLHAVDRNTIDGLLGALIQLGEVSRGENNIFKLAS